VEGGVDAEDRVRRAATFLQSPEARLKDILLREYNYASVSHDVSYDHSSVLLSSIDQSHGRIRGLYT
jgi:hypothetical protein